MSSFQRSLSFSVLISVLIAVYAFGSFKENTCQLLTFDLGVGGPAPDVLVLEANYAHDTIINKQ